MNLRAHLLDGQAIPAQPLALQANRKLSERHQRAITRYYLDAGVGGLAVGVHSTQFEIREPQHGLFAPVLKLAAEEIDSSLKTRPRPFAKIAGICGETKQALGEAELVLSLGYQAGLLSLAAWKVESDEAILAHCHRVAETIPLIGFYLQSAVGGRVFSYRFWRRFAEIPNLVAIKLAPFNRYQTLDVVRAVMEAGRDDVALYTGNDDNVVVDLLTTFEFDVNGRRVSRQIVGGLLGHWGVWTKCAVDLLNKIKQERERRQLSAEWLTRAAAITDMNAGVFDPSHDFGGCISGILEVLRRQQLVPTSLCLDPNAKLSPGQSDELTRVTRAYPEFVDDLFVDENRDRWLS
jgi:hypothetical protein